MQEIIKESEVSMSMTENALYNTEMIVYDASRRHNYEPFGDICETVQAAYGTGGNNMPIVRQCTAYDARGNGGGAISCTITGGHQSTISDYTAITVEKREDMENAVVRRLTPLECERLQGFPDGWTNIGEWTDSKGKKHKDADGPRYKALGNSIAVGYANNQSGFWCWMARRIVELLKKDGIENPTMASLFDGIGGFPLAFSAAGCKPIWASEIEEFPIAVTKIRFPETEE